MISKKKKELLCKFHDMRCEECKLKGNMKVYKIEELEIHKINQNRGYEDHRNLKIICIKHHKIFSAAQRIAIGTQK